MVDYAITEMGCFGDYSDAAPHAETMRVKVTNTFLLPFSQCITINQTKFVISTLIAKARLNSLYSRLVFKVINDFTTSPKFEEARK